MSQTAFQDQMAGNLCWGCGAGNPRGLHIKSHWAGDEAVCTWQPAAWHAAGPPHVLNGGIIATIIDCHCIGTAIAATYRAEGRTMDSAPPVWCVTASLQVSYLKPTPINAPVELRARVKERSGRKTVVACGLFSHGEECARGEVVAVRVPPEWREAEHGSPG